MLGIDRQHASRGRVEPGADPGVFGQDGTDAWLDSLGRPKQTSPLLTSLAVTAPSRVKSNGGDSDRPQDEHAHMNLKPLFPSALDAVTAHFESLGADEAVRIETMKKEGRARVWKLAQTHTVLKGGIPTLIFPHDVPLSPVRVEVDASLCLVLPHIGNHGNVCLGVVADPEDLRDSQRKTGGLLAPGPGLSRNSTNCSLQLPAEPANYRRGIRPGGGRIRLVCSSF
ncbi:MAG TPA: hypothetical protein VN428_06910 [Bryobacteraceae bacterium]|nr:hypothetical protein [Bryobacteraceae bacterium]